MSRTVVCDEPEVLERREIGRRHLLEDRARQRALERERAGALGDVLDRRRRARRAFIASQRRFGSALVRRNVRSSRRLIVPSSITLPCGVAPRRVEHLARPRTCATSRVTMRSSRRAASRPGDPVLVERRDVEQRRGVADGGVLAVGMRLVRARDLIARPPTPRLGANERGGAGVEWSRLERLSDGGTRHAAQLSPGISRSRDGPRLHRRILQSLAGVVPRSQLPARLRLARISVLCWTSPAHRGRIQRG